jgi:hypothetical protein
VCALLFVQQAGASGFGGSEEEGKTLCAGTFEPYCDNDTYEVQRFDEDNSGTGKGSGETIALQRWKCVCKVCSNGSCDAGQRCKRNYLQELPQGVSDVFRYYEFRAAACVPEGQEDSLSEEEAYAKTSDIEALFTAHSKARAEDLEAFSRQRLKGAKAAKAAKAAKVLGSSVGQMEKSNKCSSEDESGCIDFSLPSDCTHASFTQLSDLLKQATGKDITQYMQDKGSEYGVSDSECIKKVFSRSTWGKAYDSTDGPQIQFGVCNMDEWCYDSKVKPADANHAAFVTLQLKYPTGDRAKQDHRYRVAMQVSMCKDGSIKGKSSMSPVEPLIFERYGYDSDEDFCASYTTADAVFREAVATARFQLAKLRQASSDSACESATWDAPQCMNSLMQDDNAQCHVVTFESVKAINMCRVFSNGQTHASNFVVNAGETEKLASLSTCKDGASNAGKCSVKVCASKLEMKCDVDSAPVILSWKSPTTGNTITAVHHGESRLWKPSCGWADGC